MSLPDNKNLFIARQPIIDRKNRIYGYELLFRQNSQNYFTPINDDVATTELIYNAFLVFGLDSLTDGTRAFINSSKELISGDFLKVLPKEKVVIEILEREKATQSTKDACEKFRTLGYKLALDDFIPAEDNMPLLGLVNILKIDYPSLNKDIQTQLIREYKGKVMFLAEKIETREDYQRAAALGYDLFQGYFFSKPVMFESKNIKTINANLIRILDELKKDEPSYLSISVIIESDLGLAYKLLMLANSVYIGARYKVKSITQALNFLGTRELYQWISLMLMKDLKDKDNELLIKQSLIRGKLMYSLASDMHKNKEKSDYFFAGLFSLINLILGTSFEELLRDLPLTDNVKRALLGENNELSVLLNYISNIERAEWDSIDNSVNTYINADNFMNHYVNAVKWAHNSIM
jgi:EAL and modified HD-GYP domain-containing signal transduction protein